MALKSEAWNELVERYGKLIYSVIHRKLEGLGLGTRRDLSDEVFQTVFEELLDKRRLASLRKPEALRSFLMTLAVSRTVDLARKTRRREDVTETEDVLDQVSSLPEGELEFPRMDPRRGLFCRDIRKIVDEELSMMPVTEELIVRFRWEHEMKMEAIAKFLEVPLHTVGNVVRKTRERLKKAFIEKGISNA